MRKCPECKHRTSTLPVEGWLVYGRATLVDSDGEESLVALVPELILNADGFAQFAKTTCTNCGYCGNTKTFPVVRTCNFSGLEADTLVMWEHTELWVSNTVAEEVVELTATNLDYSWEFLATI